MKGTGSLNESLDKSAERIAGMAKESRKQRSKDLWDRANSPRRTWGCRSRTRPPGIHNYETQRPISGKRTRLCRGRFRVRGEPASNRLLQCSERRPDPAVDAAVSQERERRKEGGRERERERDGTEQKENTRKERRWLKVGNSPQQIWGCLCQHIRSCCIY